MPINPVTGQEMTVEAYERFQARVQEIKQRELLKKAKKNAGSILKHAWKIGDELTADESELLRPNRKPRYSR